MNKTFKVPLTEEEVAKIPGMPQKSTERTIKKVHIKIFNLEDEVDAAELADLMSQNATVGSDIVITHQENKFFENGMCKSFTIWVNTTID